MPSVNHILRQRKNHTSLPLVFFGAQKQGIIFPEHWQTQDSTMAPFSIRALSGDVRVQSGQHWQQSPEQTFPNIRGNSKPCTEKRYGFDGFGVGGKISVSAAANCTTMRGMWGLGLVSLTDTSLCKLNLPAATQTPHQVKVLLGKDRDCVLKAKIKSQLALLGY